MKTIKVSDKTVAHVGVVCNDTAQGYITVEAENLTLDGESEPLSLELSIPIPPEILTSLIQALFVCLVAHKLKKTKNGKSP